MLATRSCGRSSSPASRNRGLPLTSKRIRARGQVRCKGQSQEGGQARSRGTKGSLVYLSRKADGETAPPFLLSRKSRRGNPLWFLPAPTFAVDPARLSAAGVKFLLHLPCRPDATSPLSGRLLLYLLFLISLDLPR